AIRAHGRRSRRLKIIALEFVYTNRSERSRRDKLQLFTTAMSLLAVAGSAGANRPGITSRRGGVNRSFLPDKWRRAFFSRSARFRIVRLRNEFPISSSLKNWLRAQIFCQRSSRCIAGKKKSRQETKPLCSLS